MKILSVILVFLFGFINIGNSEEVNTDVSAVVKGCNEFGINLYREVKGQEGNLFFSPYSISTALAMPYAGAKGETESEMAKVLRFTLPQEQLHAAYGKIITDMNERGKQGNYQLSVANALWLEQKYKFLESYTNLINKNYDAGLFQVDFINAFEEVRIKINTWIEEKTNGKIKDLIPSGALDKFTRLVLTNAIYFKGNWLSQFKKEVTKDMPFNINTNEKIQVPMMYQKHEFKYGEDENVQLLEMPYVGNELSMLIILPKQVDGLSKVEDILTIDQINLWEEKLYKEEVEVYYPKFKTTKEYMLNNMLEKMGMVKAFKPFGVADFTGISGPREAKEDMLYISKILHKAFVEVNEEGTEAAAATAVVMLVATSVEPPPPVFRADHPFILFIKDNKSGSILFIGRIVNPLT